MTHVPASGAMVRMGAAVLSVTVIGAMFPYGFPLFTLSLAVYMVALLATGREFRVPVVLPFYTLLALLLISLVATDGRYTRPFQDLVDAGGAAVFLLLVHSTLRDATDITLFQRTLAGIVWGAGVVVGCIGLYKLQLLSQGVILEWFVASDGTYRAGTSLPKDYNFYAFGQIAALLAGWYLVRVRGGRALSMAFAASVPLLGANVLLSGSRRGLVVLGAVLLAGGVILSVRSARWILRRYTSAPGGNVLVTARDTAVVLGLAVAAVLMARRFTTGIAMEDIGIVLLRLQTLQDLGAVTGSRTGIWAFGFEQLASYNAGEILLGSGFDYLGAYADRFSPEVPEFTPHNMLLAGLLSGGVLTLGTLLWLLGRSAFAYTRRREELPLLLMLVVLAVPFAMTSLHLIFSFPLFLILVVLPLLPADRWRRYGRDTALNGVRGE